MKNSNGGTNPSWYCNPEEDIHINCIHKKAAELGKRGGEATKRNNPNHFKEIAKKRWKKKEKPQV